MSESLKVAVRAAVLRLLDPLVKWLMKAGVGVGDLVALVKIAYVRAAREQGLASGSDLVRPSTSRIAVLTGLTRQDVRNILAAETGEPTGDRGRQRAERVLSGWWNDPSFQDSLGRPAALPLRGSKRSFAELVARYSGEWRVLTILEELLRVKAVRRLRDGRLKPISRSYATVRWDPDGVIAFGQHLAEHCATLLHNLEYPAQPYYVARVINTRLDPRYLPILVRDLTDQAEGVAEIADDMLNDPQHTLTGEKSESEASSLGVSLYLFTASVDASAAHDKESIDEADAPVKARPKRLGVHR